MNIQETLQFEQDLYNLINNCGLPIETAFYVLKSVYLDFQNTIVDYARKKDTGVSSEQQVFKIQDNKEITENDDTVNRDNA